MIPIRDRKPAGVRLRASPAAAFRVRFPSGQNREFDMAQADPPLKRTIKKTQLRQMVPLADSTIWEMERCGQFPKRFLLTPRCVVWDLAEVEAWLAHRRSSPIARATPPDVHRRRTRPVRAADRSERSSFSG
jgi:prophage regulatory protein